MSLQGFQEFFRRDAGQTSFVHKQTSGLTAATYTDDVGLLPLNGKKSVLGCVVKVVYVLTSTNVGSYAPIAGTDVLDPILSNGGSVEIAPTSGAMPRAKTLTRKFLEFIWAVTTNTSFSVAALPTFASASAITETVSFFVPVGGPAANIRILLAGSLAASYTTGVTISFTSVETQVISSNFTGVAAFNETLTASLGSGLQDVLTYAPKNIAPDVVFMQGESSTTITQCYITEQSGYIMIQSTSTDALQTIGGAQIAPIAGATFTTTAGFVIPANGKVFSTFQVTFLNATTHNIGFLAVQGGEVSAPNSQPQSTAAPNAADMVGQPGPGGTVQSAKGSQGRRVLSFRYRRPGSG